MGQQFVRISREIQPISRDNSNTIPSVDFQDDMTYIFPLTSSIDRLTEINIQKEYIQQIEDYLFQLTKSSSEEEINQQIQEKLIQPIGNYLAEQSNKISEDLTDYSNYREELHRILQSKTSQNTVSIFSQSSSENSNRLNYFAIQSLLSILLLLIKSVEKTDPILIQQILVLAHQLAGQLPMKSLSNQSPLLFQSLTPLMDYIMDLSHSNDPMIFKQTMEILFSFASAKGALKDCLDLIAQVIFNTKDMFNGTNLIHRMNEYLKEKIDQKQVEWISLKYLQSIHVFPDISENTLINGQVLASILLSHIDLENEIEGLIRPVHLTSFSYEFHPKTFAILFDLLEQLTSATSSNILQQILFVCLRLFTRHLQLLVDLQSSINLNDYVSNEYQDQWLKLLFQLSIKEDSPSIAYEGSKGLIYVLNLQSMSNKLIFIHRQIQDNQHPILLEEFFVEFNRAITVSNWIKSLNDQQEKILIWPILHTLIDLYSKMEYPFRSQLGNFLFQFQDHLLSKLINNKEEKFASITIEYLTYILTKSINTDLFPSVLLGLCYLTQSESNITEDIQSIFLAILPLLSEYQLTNLQSEYQFFIACLIGRISQLLILGLPEDPLEIQYTTQLQSLIFTGGYIFHDNEDILQSKLARDVQCQLSVNSSEEKEFLLAIYHQTDTGARLISKLKSFSKISQRPLPKSIEDRAIKATAEILAVYIKHYRRIPLAQSELLKDDSEKPSAHLLSLYEYANRIQTFFAVLRGQGGNCDELAEEIHKRTLFLLTSIEENEFIPSINEHRLDKIQPNFHFQRQQSRWSKALHVIKLLKTLFQACLRFKKFMLEKRRLADEKEDYESLFHRALEQFIYGNFVSINKEDKQATIEEFERCFQRQHRRALIRLMIYRFFEKFFTHLREKKLDVMVYLPYLRKNQSHWSFFHQIRNSHSHLRKSISTSYYSIIRLILPLSAQSEQCAQDLFYLLSLADLSMESLQPVLETLVQYEASSEQNKSIYLQCTAFNWLRFDVFQLCQTMENDQRKNITNIHAQEQVKFIFNTLIFNTIKRLKDNLVDIPEGGENCNSLEKISFAWFLQTDSSSTLPNELYLNQYLAFFLRAIRFYPYVLTICANVSYLQAFLDLYQRISSNRTRLLLIKLFAYLIPAIPDETNGKSRDLIEKLLIDSLKSIGQRTTSWEDFIEMYRSIMSIKSPWQSFATQSVFESIRLYLNLSSIESNEMNQLIASLTILGGYIPSFRLGSIVKIENDDEETTAVIIDVDESKKKFQIQYFQSNQIESVGIDKLQHIDDVLPPIVDQSILDILGEFIQKDTSKGDSLMFIKLKRRVISVLYHLLSKKNAIEIFMEKPYAKILSQVGFSKISVDLPKDLRVFNREHLEQYCLSLDRCKTSEEKTVEEKSSSTTDAEISSSWNPKAMTPNSLISAALSVPVNGWRSCASPSEVEILKKGRMGPEEISIVPLPSNAVSSEAIKECGTKHRFHGHLAPNYENAQVSFPTFIFDQLRLTEGKWYYCVRLPVAGVVQIGWATKGFKPSGGIGVGDDKYSWSYDGERAAIFYENGVYGQFDGIRWKANDVCGCGIEINGEQTNIKYWLNGKLLGTPFAHNIDLPQSSSVKCDLLPNGPTTSYYPAVTIQWTGDPFIHCEIIVSPEDMEQCPLPAGYKPLLLPNQVQTEDSIVNYPFHAYLIGDQSDRCLLRKVKDSSNNLLRDFCQNKHLSTEFNVENSQLILPVDNNGLVLSLDSEETSSLTISFDFELKSTDNDSTDFRLINFNNTDILWTRPTEKQRCAVVFNAKEQQIQIYTNDNHRTIEHYKSVKNFILRILPGSMGQLQNLAIWKYALSMEQISRLFTYGLFYLANEDQQLKEYHRHVNRITFDQNQKAFTDQLLLPFRGPFSTTIWEQKKEQADEDESNYFKSHGDYPTIDLFGHDTYLVLNKSKEDWSNYTLILDLLIPQWAKSDEIISIITWNSQTTLHIQSNGKLCLNEQQSSSIIESNQPFCLSITLHDHILQIHLNKKLEIELTVSDDQYSIKSDYLHLFNETKNTTDVNTLRLSLQSIIYLDRYIPIDQLQSPELIIRPLEIITPYLTGMGYRTHWIESALKQNSSKKLSTILSEGKQHFIQIDLHNEHKRYRNLLSRLHPSIQPELLDQYLLSSEQTIDLARNLLPHVLTSSPASSSSTSSSSDWFAEMVQDLNIPLDFTQWIHDPNDNTEDSETTYTLVDLNQTKSKTSEHSLEYSHDNLPSAQLVQARLVCEQNLMIIYARSTLLNMLEVWSMNSPTRFPLEKFGDYSLLKFFLQDRSIQQEKNNRITSLIKSMLRTELNQLKNDRQCEIPLFEYLLKEIAVQSLEFLLQPSWIAENMNEEIPKNDQRPNYHFILQILQLTADLLSEESSTMDSIISRLFAPSLIQLIFHLFLLIPVHQSKIIILRFFTTLLRISDQWTLNEHIFQFFLQLLIELSSDNHSIKQLQQTLTDLILVLSKKGNSFIEDYRSKFPKNLQDLFTFIDIIDVWSDPKKEKSPPQTFIKHSPKVPLTNEEFLRSNALFTRMADQELLNLLNNNSIGNTLSEFLEKLPTGSEPDGTFYKDYPTLSQIPADAIIARTKAIYLLNDITEDHLAVVDLSLPPGQSFLTDQIRSIKLYLLSLLRITLFTRSLGTTESSDSSDWISVNFDTVKASTDNNSNSENTMFYQAYQQLHANAHNIFRRSDDQLWRAQYLGMHSTDQGGPYRDSITRICADICSTRLPLFILCPNGRTNTGFNRDCWIPNVFPPNQSIPMKIQKQYRFIGQLFGIAIRKKHYFDLKFPTLFWKGLLREEITIEDIEAIDVHSFRLINDMEKNIEHIQSMGIDQDMEAVFSSIMSELYFDVVSSAGQTYELIPGGSELPITAANFKDYCAAYRQYRLREFHRQIDFINQGLRSVIPSYYFSLLTAKDLEEFVCGKGEIDIELLKRNTSYGISYHSHSPVIERFWTVMKDMFTLEQKKLFLIFIWGRSTLPSRDEDFTSRMNIEKYDATAEEIDRTLPRAHTCYFTIDLPAYSSAEVMCERLNYAITYCSSIDGDGNMNDMPFLDAEETNEII